MQNPIKMDDLGVPLFLETSTLYTPAKKQLTSVPMMFKGNQLSPIHVAM